ncbi:MAG: ferritin-like domain-containing protein [Alphaproteobacteria bacterium]|nr:ferritin-like domain-containing protein [Alphaproteobacteria bacterium]
MKIKTLHDLFHDELCDVYDAETRLTEALPKMAKAATDTELKRGFEKHLEETKRQIERLRRVHDICGLEIRSVTCEAMKGLVEEGDEYIKNVTDKQVLDAALITAAQKVEHYEIAAYGSLCALADCLGYEDAAELLSETLDEEKRTDEILTEIAESNVNQNALKEAA